MQGMLLASGGPDLFRKLLEKGPDHRITQPAVYATANLAASNHAAQEALRESGTQSTANWTCPPHIRRHPLRRIAKEEVGLLHLLEVAELTRRST